MNWRINVRKILKMDFRDILRYLVCGIMAFMVVSVANGRVKKNAGSLCHDYNIHSISLVTVHCISIFFFGWFLSCRSSRSSVLIMCVSSAFRKCSLWVFGFTVICYNLWFKPLIAETSNLFCFFFLSCQVLRRFSRR